jgi:hypothetical protein
MSPRRSGNRRNYYPPHIPHRNRRCPVLSNNTEYFSILRSRICHIMQDERLYSEGSKFRIFPECR